jgi:hypothetical protein
MPRRPLSVLVAALLLSLLAAPDVHAAARGNVSSTPLT